MAVGFLFSNLRSITRKSNAQPVFAGTSSPSWPLEKVFFIGIHAYVKLIGFTNLFFLAAEVDISFF